MRRASLVIAIAAAACEPAPPAVCAVGALDSAGPECPSFRAEDGRIYSLVGPVAPPRPGEPACVCGEPVQFSVCMRGTTLRLAQVRKPADCPRSSPR